MADRLACRVRTCLGCPFPESLIVVVADYARHYSFLPEYLHKVRRERLIKTYATHRWDDPLTLNWELSLTGLSNESVRFCTSAYDYEKLLQWWQSREILLVRNDYILEPLEATQRPVRIGSIQHVRVTRWAVALDDALTCLRRDLFLRD
jgi:hypothetical protein